MSDRKFSGFGSRIVVDTQNTVENSEQDITSELNSDKPEVRVELRYFTLELWPRCPPPSKPEDTNNFKQNNNSKTSSNNGEATKELAARISPTSTASSESFYSCKSTTSLPEQKDNLELAQKYPLPCSSKGRPIKNNTVHDEDLLNQLTMVNAIFLSNNINECVNNERSKKTYENRHTNDFENCEDAKSFNLAVPLNRISSEAFACQIDPNVGIKFINNICGEKNTTNPFLDNHNLGQSLPDGKSIWSQNAWNAKINLSKSYESDPRKVRCAFDASLNKHKSISESKFVFKKRKHSSSKQCNYKRVEIKIPQMKFANLAPIHDESKIPVLVERKKYVSKLELRKQKISRCCEFEFMEPNHLQSSFKLVSPERNEISPKTVKPHCGDGIHSNKNNLFSISETVLKESNDVLKNIDESYLRALIRQSINKVKNETTKKERSDVNLANDKNENMTLSDSDEESYTNELNNDVGTYEYSSRGLQFNTEQKNHKTPPTLRDTINNNIIDYSSFDYNANSKKDKQKIKRKSSERQCPLPVIQEESSESLISSNSVEDNLSDDYCLIDNNGKPIHLFDYRGLPLTDGSGRPLRYANGELLIKCDENGIPLVEDNSNIFDMFGRQPHEKKFDPSMAPKMPVCNKLTTSDGTPLLLYDAEGRPLTSVSGTMLVDSSGRGLVRFSRGLEPSCVNCP